MPIDSQQLSAANPLAIANASYINALYRKKFGRGATRQELAKFAGRSVKDSANLVLGSSSPFTGQTTPTTTTSPDAGASESDQLQALIERLTPKPVDRGELTSRFSSLFDPTYQANEGEINRTLDLSGPRGVRLEGVTSGTGAVTATEITLANNALLAIRAMATQRVFLEGAVEIAPGGALTLSSSRIASLDPNNLGSLNNRGTLAIVPQSGQNITLSEFRSPGTLMTVAGAFPPTGQLVIENVKGTMGPIRFDYGDVLFRGPLAVADTVIFTDTTIKSVSVTGRWRNPGLLHLLPGGVLSGRNQAIPGSVQNGRLVEGTWVLNGEMNIADFTENAASIEVRPGGAIFTIGPGIRTNTGTFAVTEGGGFSFRSGLTNSGRLRVRGLGSQTSVTGTLACLPNSTIELELAAAESAVPITASVRATLAGTLAIASAPGLEGPGIRFVTLLTAPVVSGKFDTVVLPASLVASVRRYPTRVVLTTCPADFDLDGVAGPDDLADFISAYFTVPAPNSVDMDDDGVVTPDDLANFVTMYFDGCG